MVQLYVTIECNNFTMNVEEEASFPSAIFQKKIPLPFLSHFSLSRITPAAFRARERFCSSWAAFISSVVLKDPARGELNGQKKQHIFPSAPTVQSLPESFRSRHPHFQKCLRGFFVPGPRSDLAAEHIPRRAENTLGGDLLRGANPERHSVQIPVLPERIPQLFPAGATVSLETPATRAR